MAEMEDAHRELNEARKKARAARQEYESLLERHFLAVETMEKGRVYTGTLKGEAVQDIRVAQERMDAATQRQKDAFERLVSLGKEV